MFPSSDQILSSQSWWSRCSLWPKSRIPNPSVPDVPPDESRIPNPRVPDLIKNRCLVAHVLVLLGNDLEPSPTHVAWKGTINRSHSAIWFTVTAASHKSPVSLHIKRSLGQIFCFQQTGSYNKFCIEWKIRLYDRMYVASVAVGFLFCFVCFLLLLFVVVVLNPEA